MSDFCLNDDTAIHLEITENYGNFVDGSGDVWCNLILDIENEYFKYNLNTECITVSETEYIRDILKKYLNDSLEKEEEYETIEPYLTFKVEKKHGHWIINMRVNLILNGAFSGDYYNILLSDKSNVEKLYNAFEKNN